jgi:hypothetical protein
VAEISFWSGSKRRSLPVTGPVSRMSHSSIDALQLFD